MAGLIGVKMELSIRQIKAFIEWCYKKGVRKVSVGEIVVEFPETYPEPTETPNEDTATDELKDQDVLFWSS